jgi:hypothetical protein
MQMEENRKWPRMICDIETRFSAFPNRWSGKIVDLSSHGLGIVSTKNLCKGEVVECFDLMITAEVVWSDGNRAGMKIIN